MPHDVSLITTIAAGLGLALVSASWRPGSAPAAGRLPARRHPHRPGDARASWPTSQLAGQLAEIGVMLMMFGVGLHFSLDDLLAVRRIAIPGAVVQIAVATALGAALAHWWGWSVGRRAGVRPRAVGGEHRRAAAGAGGARRAGLAQRPDRRRLAGGRGPGRGAGAGAAAGAWRACWAARRPARPAASVWATLALTLGKVGAFVALMLVVGRRAVPRAALAGGAHRLARAVHAGVISAAVGVAYGSAELFSVSFALGAFFAGMMMRESALSHRAAEESLPLRDAFSVLFFVSVGMLFDPRIVLREPLSWLAVVAIIMLGKTAGRGRAGARCSAIRCNTALTVGGEPGADRRVLLHPGRPRRQPRAAAGRGRRA